MPRGASLNLKVERGGIRLSETAGPVRAEAGKRQPGGRRARRAAGDAGRPNSGTSARASPPSRPTPKSRSRRSTATSCSRSRRTRAPPSRWRPARGNVTVQDLAFTDQNLDESGTGTAFEGRLGTGAAEIRARTGVGNVELRGGRSLVLDDLAGSLDDSTAVPARRARPAERELRSWPGSRSSRPSARTPPRFSGSPRTPTSPRPRSFRTRTPTTGPSVSSRTSCCLRERRGPPARLS